jgi:hypothetical protein
MRLVFAPLRVIGGPHVTERYFMKIDRELFLSTVLALSLGGLVGCSSEEPPAAAEPEESYGAEEPMALDEPAEEATEEAAEAAEGAEEATEEGAAEGEEAADEGEAEADEAAAE